MSDCIFCKIVEKEIPNYTVYSDNRTLAFLDVHPLAKGHTVVIPLTHAESLLEMEEAELAAFMLGLKNAMTRVQTVLSPDGFTIGINHGEAAGQAVPHLHAHIVPRWRGDGGGSLHTVVNAPVDLPVGDVAKLFSS